MKKIAIVVSLFIAIISAPSVGLAIESAPRITDREIVEKLARLEEGQNTLRAEIRANAEAIRQLREDMNIQIKLLREDMNAQFNRMNNVMLGIFSGFIVLVGAIIGFALWDRRTMIRPFETKVREIEEDIAENRTKLHSLLDALRSLSKTDKRVAEVLRNFNLL